MYLLSIWLLILPFLRSGFEKTLSALSGGQPKPRGPFKTTRQTVMAIFMITPFLVSFMDEWLSLAGQSMFGSWGDIYIAIGLIGAAGTLVLAVLNAIPHYWTSFGFWEQAKTLTLAVTASIALISTSSHFLFTHGPQFGTVSLDAFRDEATDIQCNASMLLIRWNGEPDSPVQYRCPKVYLLNQHASKPFLPWPDYRTGQSAELAVALHDIMQQTPKQ